MSLYIYVEDPELREVYRNYITVRRNTDSGFDIFTPQQTVVQGNTTTKIPLGIVVGAKTYLGNCAPCLVLPRSSISKTPLRLANSIGLIDAGYRGELLAMVDNIREKEHLVEKHERLFQICAHDNLPFMGIVLVDKKEDLPFPPDKRGDGGFGSTGR